MRYAALLFWFMLLEQWSILMEHSPEDYLQQSSTNLFGAMNTARAFLPYLREQRSGVLVFMGSAAGWNGIPTLGAYCTSKFGLRGTGLSSLAVLE